MEAFFLQVLTLSLTCSAVLLPLLLCARVIRHRYAAKTLYFLWLLLALRMVLPIPLNLPKPPVMVAVPSYAIQLPTAPNPPVSGGNAHITTPIAPPIIPTHAATPASTIDLMQVLTLLWLAGVVLFLAWQLTAYLLARRGLLKNAVSAGGELSVQLDALRVTLGIARSVCIYRSPGAETPMLLGLLRPVIILPLQPLERDILAVALRHELLHFKRRDVAYKALLLLCNGVHWFNPIAWRMTREAARNLELCCDNEVLCGVGKQERHRYGEMLLATASGRHATALSTCFSGKRQLKERLYNLFHQKKNSSALVCVILSMALLAGGLVACESEIPEETAPMAGEIYATFDALAQAEETDFEIVKLAVVDYDPKTDALGEESEEQTFIMAGGVLVRLNEGENSISPGKKGTEDRKRELMNFFFWPTLRVTAYPGERDLIEIVLDEKGQVAQMTWRRTKAAEAPAVDRTDLDVCVRDAIMEDGKNKGPSFQESLATEAHATLKTVEDGDRTTVYARALYMEMAISGGEVVQNSGHSMPVAITFTKNLRGEYTLTEFWVPQDGSGYTPSIREKFPADIFEDAIYSQDNSLMQSCYAQAIEYGKIDTDTKVAALLNSIMPSPAAASNPGAYIEAHTLDYRELTYYGQYALRYCLAQFEKGGQTDLRGHIMAILCRELLGTTVGESAETGQAWYEAYRADTPSPLWPVEDSYTITSRFGPRLHPVTGAEETHTGIDIAAPAGTPVEVVADGTVVAIGSDDEGLKYLEVSHDDTWSTRYGSLGAVTARVGAQVTRGMALGVVADGMESFHYAYLLNGQFLDPLAKENFKYVRSDGTVIIRGDLNAPQW